MPKYLRENITPIIIRGEKEFAAAFGYSDPLVQQRLRNEGMPHYNDGKCFVYDPQEVLDWMKKNWRVIVPSITNKTTQQ